MIVKLVLTLFLTVFIIRCRLLLNSYLVMSGLALALCSSGGGLRGSGCLAAGACAPCSLCGAGARALRSLDLSKNNLHRILTGTVGSVF